MNDRIEILFRFFEEAMTHVRHLEEQRSKFASVLIAVAGGIVAFGLSSDRLQSSYYSGLLLSCIGSFGLLLSWKQNEKINYHRQIAIHHRRLIAAEPCLASDSLEKMRDEEISRNHRRYGRISTFPVGLFWSLLYVLILGIGIIIIASSVGAEA